MNLAGFLEVAVPFWNSRSGDDLRSSRRPAPRRGFSLVETALALGVVSFALISLLGMLPCGLQTFRKAMDFTMQTEMTQVLIGKATQTAYGNLSAALTAQPWYFDDNGNLVDATDATGTCKATVTVSNAILPAAPSYSNTGVALVTITFTRKQAPTSSPPLGTIVTYIAAMTGNSSQ